MTAPSVEPYVNFNFLVEIDRIARASFHEVTGLDSTVDIIEHREGGKNTSPIRLMGQAKHANIVLKWGITLDKELYQWHRNVVEGSPDRRNGSVVLLNRRGIEVVRWNFVRAWPTKYTVPSLTAEASDVAIESIELVHEGLERVS
jgi:phage tail-like protein